MAVTGRALPGRGDLRARDAHRRARHEGGHGGPRARAGRRPGIRPERHGRPRHRRRAILHDIGKNLVGMMLEGRDVLEDRRSVDARRRTSRRQRFAEAAQASTAPASVGITALLTTTMPGMRGRRRRHPGRRCPAPRIIIGGAPATPGVRRPDRRRRVRPGRRVRGRRRAATPGGRLTRARPSETIPTPWRSSHDTLCERPQDAAGEPCPLRRAASPPFGRRCWPRSPSATSATTPSTTGAGWLFVVLRVRGRGLRRPTWPRMAEDPTTQAVVGDQQARSRSRSRIARAGEWWASMDELFHLD